MVKKKNIIHQSVTSAATKKVKLINHSQKKSSSEKLIRTLAAGLATSSIVAFLVSNPLSYDTTPDLSPVSPVENVSEHAPAPLGESDTATPAQSENSKTDLSTTVSEEPNPASARLAMDVLEELPVKGRAAKSGYARTEFYNSWPTIEGCSLRQRILKRDLGDSAVVSSEDNCTVLSGAFTEPYTGKYLEFHQKSDLTSGLQIDHVVALSDAWQKGAQNLEKSRRYDLATDPLNLLAVDSKTNQSKSDGDAATWLPANKSFRCAYVARQISVKYKYSLWVSSAEKSAIKSVLKSCPNEPAVGI